MAAAFAFSLAAALPLERAADLAFSGFALLVAVVTEDLDFLVLALLPTAAEAAADLAGLFLLADFLVAGCGEDLVPDPVPGAAFFLAPPAPVATFFPATFLAAGCLPSAFFRVPALARLLLRFLPLLLADACFTTGRFFTAALPAERFERDFDTAFFATMNLYSLACLPRSMGVATVASL